MDYYTNSNITSKRYDDGSGYVGYVQPSITSQASRSAAVQFYPNRDNQQYKPASSNGFLNNSNSGLPP